MSEKAKAKQLQKMLKDFVKLQPDEALGIFRVLNINLVDEEKKEVKLFEQLLSEFIDKYSTLNRRQCRTLDAIIATAALPEEKKKKK